jgi:rRNA maturation endonuclease Nob1
MVTCPTCGKPTVRKVAADEDLTGEDERATWVNLSEAERNVIMRAGAQRQRA